MRHINGIYTQRYNARNGCDGTLFRGRYKSILVDGDSYLLELVRYIHRNPLRAGITDKLKDYSWSSHKGYISKANKWEWLNKNCILDMFSWDNKLQIAAYKRFVSKKEPEEIIDHYSKANMPAIIGSEEFNLSNYSSVSNAISRVKRKLRSNKFKKRYEQIFDSL